MAHDSKDRFYNPLKRYRSYSYHHMLIACDSTRTAGEIEKVGNITELQRTRQQQGDTTDSKYTPQVTETGGKFVVLIDGLVDSDFTINSVEWSTVIAPTKKEQHAMMNTEGKIQIHEPFGVAFTERLINLGAALETDMTGVLFTLKTIFVGHQDNEAPHYNTTMLPHYRPFLFTMANITAVINETGSYYEMSVMGASNGFAKLPHVSNMGKGFSANINTSDTLEDSLKNVFIQINDLYLKQASDIGIEMAAAPLTGFAEGGEYRQVSYHIVAPDYNTPDYHAGTNENELTEVKSGIVAISFGEGATIDEIVDTVMRSSKEVMEDSGPPTGEQQYIFKITSMLDSTPDEMNIVYEVHRYKMATTPYLAIQNNIPSSIPEEEIRTYNYIFTGENTDILDLDIKMNMGLSFFHTASSSSHPVTQDAFLDGGTQCRVAGGSDGGQNTADGKPRPKTPLFLGDKVTDSTVRNAKDPISTASYHALLSKHAFLESTAITMKIVGDPVLMSEVLVTSEAITPQNIGQTRERSYLATPIIFRVNIQYPIDGSLRPFWYRGLYTLHSVDNRFENGEFTQTLTLYSLPTVTESSEIYVCRPPESYRERTGGTGGNPPAPGTAGVQEGKTATQAFEDTFGVLGSSG